MAVRYPCPKMSGGIARTRGKSPRWLFNQPPVPRCAGRVFFVGGASVPLGGVALFSPPFGREQGGRASGPPLSAKRGQTERASAEKGGSRPSPREGGQAEGRGGRLGRHRTGGDSANGEPHPHRRHPHRRHRRGGAGRGWPALSEAQDRAAILRRDPHCESRYPAARSVSRRYPAAAFSRSRRYPAATRTKEPRYPAGRRKGECAAILRRTPPAEPLSCGGATRAAILRPEDCPQGGRSAALGVRFAALGSVSRHHGKSAAQSAALGASDAADLPRRERGGDAPVSARSLSVSLTI